MPLVSFTSLPPSARIWIFGSNAPVLGVSAELLLAQVDEYLESWKAHGTPLVCARQWTEDRFLVVAIDLTVEQASGCSIDGLFRALKRIEYDIGANLVGGGRVFYRGPDHRPTVASAEQFHALAARGEIPPTTSVFDTTLSRLGELPTMFELPLPKSWARNIVPPIMA